jgi:hypothetical protein
MTATPTSSDIDRGDLIEAIDFAQRCFQRWHESGLIRAQAQQAIAVNYTKLRESLQTGAASAGDLQLSSAHVCWSCKQPVETRAQDCGECGAPAHTPETQRLRFLLFVCREIERWRGGGLLALTEADGCLADSNALIAALRRKLDGERIPLALPGDAVAASAPAQRQRRNLMEILLDPRSIQWLLALGGVLLVVGLVIWLAAAGYFENKLFVAVCLGAGNGALLAGGWALIRFTRYQMAGRAVTLLACLLMPLNLWFYNAQGLITLSEGGHLWMPALVCCLLYTVSARLLRDPMFVYVLVGGVTLTGLLILADNDVQGFWEIARPSALLVVLGLLCIHAERAFPPSEGPFSRRRFGLAFFWSGHAVLGAGLLLLLGAQVCGDWLYDPFFQSIYAAYDAVQPAIVSTEVGRLMALGLVLAAIYAYLYSDLVVRRIGVYVYLAVLAVLWAEVLLLQYLFWKFGWQVQVVEALIVVLALTGLTANLALNQPAARTLPLLRLSWPLGVCLSVLPVLLGVGLHFRATMGHYVLEWPYVTAMLTAALSCRTAAQLFRHSNPPLSLTYFFGTGAATLAGAAGLLKVVGPEMLWQHQAPILMLIPLLYLLAARLYQGHTPEKPLLWVGHAAVVVMLISSLGAAFKGFLSIQGENLNLLLACFFAEATLFYLLEALWRKHAVSIAACTATACAAVWQLLRYTGVQEEYYVLTFAIVGLLLLIAYRFAVLEGLNLSGLAGVAFHGGNALMSLAFVAGALIVLSKLSMGRSEERGMLIFLLSALIAMGIAALALVRQPAWRRWYATTAIGNAALIVLVLAILGVLTPAQKLEIVAVTIGLLLLIVGHLGWFREQERHNDMVTLCLVLGSVLLAVPLAITVVYCRYARAFDTFHTLNEVGMLVAGLLLLATGFMFRIKSTTLGGAFLCVLYLMSLLLYLTIPDQLQTTAVYIMAGGGAFFAAGLLLSLYRDRLLTLPDRIKRREGIFRILTWR